MNLSSDLMKMMELHALESPDREVCGFVYSDRYIPLENVSRDPNRFVANPAGLAKVLAAYGEPPGIFHTHPGGNRELSFLDREAWYYMNSTIIIGVMCQARFVVKCFLYGHQGD